MRGLSRLGVGTLGAQCRDVIIFVLVVTVIEADGFHHPVISADGRVAVLGNVNSRLWIGTHDQGCSTTGSYQTYCINEWWPSPADPPFGRPALHDPLTKDRAGCESTGDRELLATIDERGDESVIDRERDLSRRPCFIAAA